MIAYFCSEK